MQLGSFIELAYQLKSLKRAGWVRAGLKEPSPYSLQYTGNKVALRRITGGRDVSPFPVKQAYSGGKSVTCPEGRQRPDA